MFSIHICKHYDTHFEATTIEKEAALKEALNAKTEVMHLKNELHQV
jgi:hypothetical protein